uniref:Uncharacterized protein n=1 Tax=Meloidogyne enterolobii TaxID=390850 RepID=A0A6V7VZ52_MELEN|nr:unnamed protein product [Meloidogyne enterolobii]
MIKFNYLIIFSIIFLSIFQLFNNGPTLTLAIIAPLDQQVINVGRKKRQYADVNGGNEETNINSEKKFFLFEQLGLRKKRQYAEEKEKESLIDKTLKKLGFGK